MSLLENRLFFILALFFTIIVAAGTSFLVLRFFASPVADPSDSPTEERRELGEIYEFGEIVVNLAGTDARRFIRLFLVFELSHRRVEDEIEARRPQIQDRILSILRSKKVVDLSESHQIEALKEEIKDFINPFLTNGQIIDLYFTEFVIQ